MEFSLFIRFSKKSKFHHSSNLCCLQFLKRPNAKILGIDEEKLKDDTNVDLVDLMCPLTMNLLEKPVRILKEDKLHVFSETPLRRWVFSAFCEGFFEFTAKSLVRSRNGERLDMIVS